jgi:hypothetical protein
MRRQLFASALLLVLLLAACRSTETPSRPTPTPSTGPEPTSTAPVEPSPTPTSPVSPISPISPLPPRADAVATAVMVLAAELGVPADAVNVLSVVHVEWPDASLGCPRPGEMYATVIVPGYRVVLEVQGQEYEVHTDETGGQFVICEQGSQSLNDPQAAFRALFVHLAESYPGFGLGQWIEWDWEDRTAVGLVGAVTQVWWSGPWSLELSYPVIPEPSYQAVLSHLEAGVVWSGTLDPDGSVVPDAPVSVAAVVGECDESIPVDTLGDWASVDISVQDGAVHIEQNLSYVCCADIALAVGQDGTVVKVIETNAGQICRCLCGYPLRADVTGLAPGTVTVEVWGVQYFDVHPLELLGSAEVTIP